MKTFATTVLAVVVGASATFAHEIEGGSKERLFGLKPEYIHVLLNPLPVYGLGIGLAILAVGLLTRNRASRITGLIVTAFCAALAWPVLSFGERGYNDLYPLLDTESQHWLDLHMDRAERFVYCFYATSFISAAALVLSRKFSRAASWLAILALAIGAGSLGIAGWISRAGGQVRHSEFRTGEVPTNTPAHSHDRIETPSGAHDQKEMSRTNDGHEKE